MTYKLPNLPYSYEALELHLDSKTMEIHHSKHHNTYVTKLNAGLEKHPDLLTLDIQTLISKFNDLPEEVKMIVKNHGGGHFNHSIFWETMTPNYEEPSENLQILLGSEFGGFENFISKFKEMATNLFGSGWTWVIKNKEGKIEIKNYPNQENPLMYGDTPILGIDVWEHAYYLKNQNRRNEYIDSWFQVINWKEVENRINK
jgi:superoxide dismutase, Fe-Mn family